MGEKGQVTLFIIVGIVILFLIALFVALIQSGTVEFAEEVPDEFKPIVKYTDSCIQNVAWQGAFELKMQGGYIDLPDSLKEDDSLIDFGFKVPYWFHDERDYMPSRLFLEEQLEDYIDSYLHTCLDSYEEFSHIYEVEVGEPESSVDIQDTEIIIETHLPLQVDELGRERVFHWDSFYVEISDKLGRLHSIAADIMEYENTEFFLEDYTDEMIVASDYLPFGGMELSCTPEVYFEEDLKEYTQTLIMHNLNFLQFLNTDYQESGIPYYDKLYKVDFTNRNYQDLKVDVMYNPDWDMDFEVHPSSSGVVKPFTFEAFNFIRTCIQLYQHRYNLEFPVLIRIVDSRDSSETFQFATPVKLRKNIPDRYGNVEGWDVDVEDIDDEHDYCQEVEEITHFDLAENGSITTREGSVDRRQHRLNIFVRDPLYGYPDGILEGVDISYQCVEARCHIGTTGYDARGVSRHLGASPGLEARFPECSNGLIVAEKEGYHTAIEHMTIDEGAHGSQVTVDMYGIKPFDYRVRVIENHGGLIKDRDLRDDEEVIISIKNKEKRFEETAAYPIPDDGNEDYWSEFDLLMGNFEYELDITLTWRNSLSGGTKLNWSTDVSDLINNEEIVFYVYKESSAVPPSSPDEIYELYNESLEKSVDFPPRFRR